MKNLTDEDREFSRFCFYAIHCAHQAKKEVLEKADALERLRAFVVDEAPNFQSFTCLGLRPLFVDGIFELIYTKMNEPELFGKRTHIPTRLKYMKDRRPCAYCGIENPGHIDHIWPKALGGPDSQSKVGKRLVWNFVQSCELCNRLKGFAPLSCTAQRGFLEGFMDYCESQLG